MKILDKYIIRKFISTFLFVIFIFVLIAIVFDISEKLDNFLRTDAPIDKIIFEYYFTFIPFLVMLFAPLFIFIAVIFFTSKLANQSEIIGLLNGRISFYRMLYPYFIAATILAFGVYTINSWILPPANKIRVQFENEYIRGSYINSQNNIHIQDAENPNLNYFLKDYNNYDTSGTEFAMEEIIDGQLKSRLFAKRIRWSNGKQKWTMHNYYVRTFNGMEEHFEGGFKVDTVFGILPDDFARPLNEDISQMNNAELGAYIDELKKKGRSNIAYFEVEKHKRYSVPFATFILTLIGVSLSSRRARGGIGLHLAIGIGIAFSYVALLQFSTTFATNANFSPIWAAWLPNILYSFVAVVLMYFAPK